MATPTRPAFWCMYTPLKNIGAPFSLNPNSTLNSDCGSRMEWYRYPILNFNPLPLFGGDKFQETSASTMRVFGQ